MNNLADQLPAFDRNPRKITEAQRAALKRSLLEYGDLGGILFNLRTKHLVGGHQRVSDFASDPEAKVTITDKLEVPDRVGTIAYGYVETNGTRYSYREVDWPEEKEITANIAANKHGGSFDFEKVSELLKEVSGKFDLTLTGFPEAELDELLDGTHKGIPRDDAETKGQLLQVLKVSVADPTTAVERGQTWQLGIHTLVCCSVFTEYQKFSAMLCDDVLFLPFAGPLCLLTETAKTKPCLIVNPDTYICGHIIDRWQEGTKESATLLRP